ncbi:MAG TPA: enoyl-CoA hydratase/isomerase family protein, partial [Candidatus Competibacteraceae bacterium]|nr:enoyl-CoA hydratase/isomerase family protein [Candidatus Competibacteraceae bacterium]
MAEFTQLTLDEAVARITLNRPASYNALDLALARELSDMLLRLSTDESVRVIIITGAGEAFSAG